MTNQYLSIAALLVSLISLYLSFRNRKTRLQSFSLAQETHNRNAFDIIHLETKSFQGYHIIKMVVLNPSSTSLILNCVKLYRPKKIVIGYQNFLDLDIVGTKQKYVGGHRKSLVVILKNFSKMSIAI